MSNTYSWDSQIGVKGALIKRQHLDDFRGNLNYIKARLACTGHNTGDRTAPHNSSDRISPHNVSHKNNDHYEHFYINRVTDKDTYDTSDYYEHRGSHESAHESSAHRDPHNPPESRCSIHCLQHYGENYASHNGTGHNDSHFTQHVCDNVMMSTGFGEEDYH